MNTKLINKIHDEICHYYYGNCESNFLTEEEKIDLTQRLDEMEKMLDNEPPFEEWEEWTENLINKLANSYAKMRMKNKEVSNESGVY